MTFNQKTIFDLANCPLVGSNLLEAGAGTGKTFSLSYLYLRLLLEKGLFVEQILVTTFTNAATAELKARIFDVIEQANKAFSALQTKADETPFEPLIIAILKRLRQQLDDHQIQKRLRLAIAEFELAKIYTIDGFALQLLRENIDTLNIYNPEQIQHDDSDFIKTAYLNLARENFICLENPEAIGQMLSQYHFDEIIELLTALLNYPDYVENAYTTVLKRAEKRQQLIEQIMACERQTAFNLVEQAIQQHCLRKTTYKIEKLQQFGQHLDEASAYNQEALVKFFAKTQLQSYLMKGKNVDFSHDFFSLCQQLYDNPDAELLINLAHYQNLLALMRLVQKAVGKLKAQQMTLTHKDITARVADAAQSLTLDIQAALIDEAQDTSKAQIKLFKKLFLDKKEIISFFVGDPKQAIYGFRGANLASYLALQSQLDNHYIMDTNYRSSAALNASINAFFTLDNLFLNPLISYHQIQSHQQNDTSSFAQKSLSLVTSPTAGIDSLAQTAAKRIARLLQENHHIQQKPLSARDIAVLVRTTNQAKKMKAALADYGLSASFTGKIGIYETLEAQLLLMLLDTLQDPSSRRVKSLMLTPLFAYTSEDILDKDLVTNVTQRLRLATQDNLKQGFHSLFYQLMAEFSIAANLLKASDGKRRLTNFIQLFECLQAALKHRSLSLAGLCDYLTQQMHSADKQDELRLEDENAINIMTMHTAKGLEFGVVCLPFFDYHHNLPAKGLCINHSLEQALPAFLKPTYLNLIAEEQAENRRLAYVALTRAKYYNLIICQPDKKSSRKSPPKTSSKTKTQQSIKPLLKDLLTQEPERIINAGFCDCDEDTESPTVTVLTVPNTEKPPLYQAKKLQHAVDSVWQLVSFSRLQQQVVDYQTKNQRQIIATEEKGLLSYPAGKTAGSALHAIYEHYMQHRKHDQALTDCIATIFAQQFPQKEQETLPNPADLADAIIQTTTITLSPQRFCLADIDPATQSIEMEFFLHLSEKARHQLLKQFSQDGNISYCPTQGFIHGYIDLCFSYQEQFYILDYKSNRLGNTFSDYQFEHMQAEMQHHRYDLQALIYTVALCKHLFIKTQQQYDKKIAGYYYLFVRGMQKNQTTGIYFQRFNWQMIKPLLQ